MQYTHHIKIHIIMYYLYQLGNSNTILQDFYVEVHVCVWCVHVFLGWIGKGRGLGGGGGGGDWRGVLIKIMCKMVMEKKEGCTLEGQKIG